MKTKHNPILIFFISLISIVLILGSYIGIYALTHPVVALFNEDGSLIFKGKTYFYVHPGISSVFVFRRDKYLGNVNSVFDGNGIYSIKYDKKDYLCISAWDGASLYSQTNADFTKGNEITTIYFGSDAEYIIDDKKDCRFLLSLKNITGDSYTYKSQSSGRFCISMYGSYDHSAIATEWFGSIAHTQGKWIYVSKEAIVQSLNTSVSASERTYTGVIIKDINTINELKRITRGIDSLRG